MFTAQLQIIQGIRGRPGVCFRREDDSEDKAGNNHVLSRAHGPWRGEEDENGGEKGSCGGDGG